MESKIVDAKWNEELRYFATLPEGAGMEVVASERFCAAYQALCNTLEILNDAKKEADAAIKNAARRQYMATGDTHVETGTFKATFVAGTISKRFDVTRFKKERPDLYEEYLGDSPASDSIRVKLKD